MKINGYTIPLPLIIPILVGTFWLGSLSVVVADNSAEIEAQAQTPVRLATIELTLNNIKEKMVEQKIAQDKKDAITVKTLDKILEKVSGNSS